MNAPAVAFAALCIALSAATAASAQGTATPNARVNSGFANGFGQTSNFGFPANSGMSTLPGQPPTPTRSTANGAGAAMKHYSTSGDFNPNTGNFEKPKTSAYSPN